MNRKIRVMVLGLGNFGHSWADSICPACSEFAELAAVVDRRPETWCGIPEEVPRFSDMAAALEQIQPDLVINVTPPDVHRAINTELLQRGIAVLCEKPIADSYENAAAIGEVIRKNDGFLMIGENYRYHKVFREARKILKSGALGKIHQAVCHFRHYHSDFSMFYHGTLQHPLLMDVTVHHLDLARYLSGEEPRNVWCREYDARYSWYGQRPASAVLVSEMTGDVVFHYNGTLASPVSTTDWNGNWEIECDLGAVQIRDSQLYVVRDYGTEQILFSVEDEDSRVELLREACRALCENRKGETDYADNLRSYCWMDSAIRSAEIRKQVDIVIPGGAV